MGEVVKPLSGRRVFLYFFLFFGVIVAVNAVFIIKALETHSGVVTERPYEKGLAFNKILEKARAQPDINHKILYAEGVLRWEFPIENADVIAVIVRPIKDGYDFEIPLEYVGDGVYQGKPQLPHLGAWTVKLKATWDDNQTFQTRYDLIAK